MRKLILWLLFFAEVAFLDAMRDAGYGHEHWLRSGFLWTDWWHFVKWGSFYGPLVVILHQIWPLWRQRYTQWGRAGTGYITDYEGRIWQWYNVRNWLLAAAVGWIAWEIGLRIGDAPWL